MYEYIEGLLSYKSPLFAVLDVQGVGYKINTSVYTYGVIQNLERAKLYIYQVVREDDMQLYGFSSESERQLFIHLLTVSGIGPNTARIILSGMSPEETRQAILRDDELSFNRVKGIGPKTAKRIIIELKDKVYKDSNESIEGNLIPANNTTKITEEASFALVALGFPKITVNKVLSNISRTNEQSLSVEELIKKALKELS